MNGDLNREILDQLRSLGDRVDKIAETQIRNEEKYVSLADSFKERTKHIEELMSVLNQGKTAAKLIAVLIAILSGLGASWDWVVAHIRIL